MILYSLLLLFLWHHNLLSTGAQWVERYFPFPFSSFNVLNSFHTSDIWADVHWPDNLLHCPFLLMCSTDEFTYAYVARIITLITVKYSVDGLACTTVTFTVTITTLSLSNVTRRLEFRRQIKTAEHKSKMSQLHWNKQPYQHIINHSSIFH